METFEDLKKEFFGYTKTDKISEINKLESIILVDDNPIIRETLYLILENYFNVICCSSYRKLKESLTTDIKIIILDIKMFRMDGIAIFNEVKKFNKNVRIIFHSAYPGSDDKAKEANNLDHNGYFIKGEYNSEELITALNKLIRNTDITSCLK